MKLKFQVATIALLFAGLGVSAGVAGGPLAENDLGTPASDICTAVVDEGLGAIPGFPVTCADDPIIQSTVDGAVAAVDEQLGTLPTDPPCDFTAEPTCLLGGPGGAPCDPSGDPADFFTCVSEIPGGAVDTLLGIINSLPVGDATAAFCTVFATATTTDETACNDAIAAGDPTYFAGIITDQVPDPQQLVADLLASLGPSGGFDAAPTAYTGIQFTVSGTYDEGLLGGFATFVLNLTVDDGTGAVDIPVTSNAGIFSATYTATSAGTYTFNATFSYDEDQTGVFTANATLDVPVSNLATGGTTAINVNVNGVPTQFTLDGAAFGTPAADVTSTNTFVVTLQDDNGFGDLVADPAATLAGPGLASPVALTLPTPVDDGVAFTRTYTFAVDFAGHLKDGLYNVTVTYQTVPLWFEFTVANAAPTGSATAGTGTAQVGQGPFSGSVDLTVDDPNWLAYGNIPVTELDHIALTASANTGAIAFTVDGTPAAGGLWDLSAATSPAPLTIGFTYDGTGTAGTVEISAEVFDDDGLSVTVPLYTLTIKAANDGFFLNLDDGGDGTQMSAADPGTTTDSRDDPLAVAVTGTLAAGTLMMDVPDFTSGANTIGAEGVTVEVYTALGDIGVNPAALTGSVAGNVVSLDLATAGIGAAGTTLYVVFSLDVPLGTPAGAYSTNATVSGIQA